MSGRKRLGALCAIAALIVVGGVGAVFAADPTPADLVDALNGVFGKHAGDRAAHAKGFCMTGTFTPSADAPKLSKAPHFAKQVPIRARFSLGGGDPKAPDNAQDNVRGLAVKFDLGGGASTDIVTISAPMFFAADARVVRRASASRGLRRQGQDPGVLRRPSRIGAAERLADVASRAGELRDRRTTSAFTPSPSPTRPESRRWSNISSSPRREMSG